MITIQITNSLKSIKVSLPRIKRLIRLICKRFQLCDVMVSIAIVDNAQIRNINARFLNRKSATDCLSFDLSDEQTSESDKSFELVVNGQLALKEAKLRGHNAEAELALYIAHGLLHNLGFNDSTVKQAKKIHRMEDEILQQFGYGSVYNKST